MSNHENNGERRSGPWPTSAIGDGDPPAPPSPDDWLHAGLELAALGRHITALGDAFAEAGRVARQDGREAFAARFAGLIPEVSETIGHLETIKIGMRAHAVQLLSQADE